ncbi:hypothetical protein P691DRAFT_50701 [Macrolepiota fuliginosa MF-IS2]|uniref:NYN domain-containing protein n=1 Tax=Macrolepiota fuliginosa MF-IS2 TaxID=1400762 RepID=A0A9P5XC84_9AGAR|nr:hypothetical protein P691DRAFT_50701 [Macrolepiota fuliginosa MF-IS2]
MPQPRIRVFWDLDTCPPPTLQASPWEVLEDVRIFTSSFGVVTNIRAYWDKNKDHSQLTNSADPLRSAMLSKGMSLVDCSMILGYTKDTLTRTLAVDVLVSVMDEPANSDTSTNDIVMIFSGDEGVLYPISLLMFRNYTVFLVVPDDNRIPPFQATRIFKWHKDILGSKFKEPRSIRSPLNTLAGIRPSVYAPSPKPASGSAFAATPKSNTRSLPTSEPSGSRVPSVLNMRSQTPANGFGGASEGGSGHGATEPRDNATKNNGGWGMDDGWNTSRHDWEMANNDWALDSPSKTRESEVNSFGPDSTEDPWSSRQSEQGSIFETQPEVPQEVPMSVFDPILQVLRDTKKRSIGRSKLGEELSRNKSIYKVAGVKGFGEYIALAVQKEVVIAGGIGNNLYVRLHPKMKNAQ